MLFSITFGVLLYTCITTSLPTSSRQVGHSFNPSLHLICELRDSESDLLYSTGADMALVGFLLPRIAVVVLLSCWLRQVSSDSAFNQTLLLTLNTSNPALLLTYQLAFDSQNNRLLVADLGNRRLVSFSTNPPYSSSVVGGPGAFSFVSGVAIANDGTIWAGQSSSLGVLQLGATGATILQNITGKLLTTSTICGLAIDSASGAVFVSDSVSGRVVKIDPTSGAVLQIYSSPTNGTWEPWGIAVYSGYLYIGDDVSSTVMKLTVDSGALVQQYDVQNGLPFKSYPTGVTFDSIGNMYVADSHRVWKIDPASGLLLAMWNDTTTNIRTFEPSGMALGSGLMYVSAGDRVLVFSDLNTPTPANAAHSSAGSLPAALLVVLALHVIQSLTQAR